MKALRNVLALAVLLSLVSCRSNTPDQAFKTFFTSLSKGDAEAVWQSFSQVTRERLTVYLAKNAAPSQRETPPQELLVHTGLLRSMREVIKVEVLNQSQGKAVLEITDELNERQQISMVLEEEHWRIVLELPPSGA